MEENISSLVELAADTLDEILPGLHYILFVGVPGECRSRIVSTMKAEDMKEILASMLESMDEGNIRNIKDQRMN